MEEAGDCVRVMTVHGAKGLEAPVVFLPDTSSPPQARNDECVFLSTDGPIVSAAKRDDDTVSAAARAAAEARNRREHLRLLYVAMTRARDRLIVCGYEDGRYGNGAAQGAWHELVGDALKATGRPLDTPFGKGVEHGEARMAAAGIAARMTPLSLPAWLRTPVLVRDAAGGVAPSRLKGEPPAFSPIGRESKRFKRGLMIHGLLQRLPDIAQRSRAEAARAWLRRQGVGEEEARALAQETLAIVDDGAFKAYFGPDSRAETPIVGVVRGFTVRGVVDRLSVRADGVDILDFKSDRPAPTRPEDAPAAYVLQMALYRAVLMSIFPGKAISCALLWTEKPTLTRLDATRMEGALDAFFAVEAA
jgi:ATP-dependent helicase/nuclease subunit A